MPRSCVARTSSTRRASSMAPGSGSRTSCCEWTRRRVLHGRRSAGRTRSRTPSSPATPRRRRCSRCARTSSSWSGSRASSPSRCTWCSAAARASRPASGSSDHMAYYRSVKRRFEESVAGEHPWPPRTYPEPVGHCEVCRWDEVCRARRRADDHLSLVAGITTRTRTELQGPHDVTTRRALGALPLPLPVLEHTKAPALMRVREQARIQVEGEDEGRPKYELLDHPTLARTALWSRTWACWACRSPAVATCSWTSKGDPFALDDGVDYLFGIWEPALIDPATGGPTFHAIWSRDADGQVTHAAEQRAFERRRRPDHGPPRQGPRLHVYHYASYEPTAFGRLMGRYATGRWRSTSCSAAAPSSTSIGSCVRASGRRWRATPSRSWNPSTATFARRTSRTPAAPSPRSRSGWSWAVRPVTRSNPRSHRALQPGRRHLHPSTA